LPKTIITRAPSVWLPWCDDDLTQVTYYSHWTQRIIEKRSMGDWIGVATMHFCLCLCVWMNVLHSFWLSHVRDSPNGCFHFTHARP
jgi:hypothetical protein